MNGDKSAARIYFVLIPFNHVELLMSAHLQVDGSTTTSSLQSWALA